MKLLSFAVLVVLLLVQNCAWSQPHQLPLNQVLPLTNLSSSTSYSIPSANPVSISVTICLAPNDALPSISIRNGTSGRVTNIAVSEGIASFEGFLAKNSILQINVNGNEMDLDIAVSDSAPLQSFASTLPQVGDTSSTQAILFSPVFAASIHTSPTFPNYTLPFGELDPPTPPANIPNFTLILVPSEQLPSQFPLQGSLCAVQRLLTGINDAVTVPPSSSSSPIQVAGLTVTTNPVLKGIKEGWRLQWLVEGLQPATNYTVWTIQDSEILGGPINALTKSASFACTLAHSIPFCPATAWAIPLPSPPDGTTTYTSSNLPSDISDPLISTITNFTFALLTLACGRDLYSPIKTCEDCAFAYRSWACAISLPRCADSPTTGNDQSSALRPALIEHPAQPVRTNLTTPQINTYTELLPCIEICTLVDRSCPPLFGWQCPILGVTANTSYGVGLIDALEGTGDGFGSGGVREGGGPALVGSGQSAIFRYGTDRYGTAWCNGNG